MWKFTQMAFTGGRLDAELMGRQDLAQYYKGASELKNFVVRRQGYLSKRRGTDFLCNLDGLLGFTTNTETGERVANAIGKSRLIALVHERDKGYYILATNNRAFLCSKDGVRLMNGEYAKSIEPSFTYTDTDGEEKEKQFVLEDYEENSASNGGYEKDPYNGDKAYSIEEDGYDTLQSAINHATSGDRIMVRQDATETATINLTTPTNITLDLNGHSVNFTNTAAFFVINHKDAKLKIVNSGELTRHTGETEEDVCISHTTTANTMLVTVTAGHLVLGNGGDLCGKGVSTASNGVNLAAGGKFTLDGGKIKVNYNAIVCTAGCYVRVNKGEITSLSQCAISGTCTDCEINGGIINAVYGLNSGIKATVNGGFWTCTNRPFHSQVTVNGGRFKLSVDDYTYTQASTVTKRGEFYCEVANTEITASLALGGAVDNLTPTRTVDGLDYMGYKQPGEPDYHYDSEENNFISDEAPYKNGEDIGEVVAREIPIEQDKRPFYVSFPASDNELEELDFAQSGDTIIFAHKAHAPFKLTFDGTKFAIERISFANAEWERPRILSVIANDNSKFGDGATKTVYYACTYVKNGVESALSAPFGYTYRLPWGDTASLRIVCDKGNNATEPDYYNIYKKESAEYGIIATIGSERAIHADVEITGENAVTVYDQLYWYDDPDGGSAKTRKVSQPLSYYVNARHSSVFLGYSNIDYHQYAILLGGFSCGRKAEFYFGENSGITINRVCVGLDAFTRYARWSHKSGGQYYLKYYFSGECFRVSLTTTSDNGERTFIKTVSSARPNVAFKNDLTCGLNNLTSNTLVNGDFLELDSFKFDTLRREIEVDFSDELKEAYPTKTSSATATKDNYQVKSITIEAFDNDIDFNPVEFYCSGVQFLTNEDSNKEFEDDYITPDLSVTPPERSDYFTNANNFPSCVAFYKQRLAFASSVSEPFTFWLSCVGDLYNFNTHASIREDDAISATLAATEFPQINHIIVNRDLMMLADSGEWKVAPLSGNTLSYKTVSADMQSAIGCAKNLKPIAIGDEIVFVKRTGETLLATRYNFTSDGYESMDLSVLSQWIFRNNPIVQMAYRQHPDSTIECVLADGTMASLVYMKEHEVCAWSRHELGGGWKATGIATSKAMSRGSTEVVMTVEKGGKHELWAMRDDVPVRDSAPAAADHLCMDGMRKLEGEAEGMAVVEVGGKRYAGHLYKAEFATVRPEPQGGETIQFEVKNAKDAEVRVLDSGDFCVRAYGVAQSLSTKVATLAKTSEDGSVALATGDFKRTLAGCNNGDGRVVVESETPFPLNILSISVNYEIQPLSGSAG